MSQSNTLAKPATEQASANILGVGVHAVDMTAAVGLIQEALAEAKAAQRLARVYQDSLRHQSEAALHSAVVAYENDQTSFLDLLDSQMTVVDVDLAWIDGLGEFNTRMADLELAAGAQIEQSEAGVEEGRQ